ncbi:NAD(+) diphosphatase [Amaricoccus macauensis]|uniref:NAD(+) diphosphatase n=1 Tax=Amaricoccus macauensis TaxID=57001 RepID=UPI003C7A353D
MKDAEAATFSGATLDRAAHFRADPGKLAEFFAHPEARCLPFWRNRALLEAPEGTSPALTWLETGHPIFASATEAPVFLGLEGTAPRFARLIPDWEDAHTETTGFLDPSRTPHPDLPPRFVFADLRASMGQLAQADAGNAATARGLFAWHETHGYCARCGAPSEIDDGGWRRTCPACGAHHFPRTDPVVIMLITHGNSLLLGRSPGWPEGMYSLLAGFMEPGETVEAAVRRETFEETGVPVGEVGYLASQPWPFPSSLMIGCHGVALGRDIRLDPKELDNALWLTREDTLRAMIGDLPGVWPARKGSIARFLIERWLADSLA